jgi:hypothetical protein
VSRLPATLSQGIDYTRAAVAYLLPLLGSADRLEPMPLPHSTMPPQPPAGNGFRQAVHAVGSERGTMQLEAAGSGLVARLMAERLQSTTYTELRSDQIARRRAAAGRTPAKPTRVPQWLYAGDNSPDCG